MRTAFDVQPGRILVVHPDRKAQRALHRVLSSTLCPVEIVELDAAVAVAADDPAVPTVIVIDQPLARTRPELVAGPGLAWIAVPCDDVQPARPEVVAELMAAGWRHVIGAPIALAGAELLIAVQKLLRGDPFGIDKHLGWGATIEATTLEDAGDRPAVVARLVEGAGRAGMSERVASLASVIVDELLANALFGAPAGGGGTRRDRADARFDSRPLAAREQVQLR
ncbi:MAG: hypothetical protein KC464_08100, partial [Myxococcales bacterium]|nr:hypothetical protein [Myxococcales bacterium]